LKILVIIHWSNICSNNHRFK